MIVTRDVLDNASCSAPGCDHQHDDVLVLSAGCHPGTPLRVEYHRRGGILVAMCSICAKEVAKIAVAEGSHTATTH